MKRIFMIILAGLLAVAGSACGREEISSPSTQVEEGEQDMAQLYIDDSYTEQEGVEVIYLAGGCFWGMEKLAQSINGVVRATSGYANGQSDGAPTYQHVVTGTTGYRETVRVEYEPDKVSLDTLLFAFFDAIDPTLKNAQGGDVGTQYQTGVYYADDAAKQRVAAIAAIEKQRYEKFAVEIGPLQRFYDAEDYHQDYLDNNPYGYCHITPDEFERVKAIIVDAGDYPRPSDEEIKEMLTDKQYEVTQAAGTEVPFTCEYWDNHERGMYVDIVTGEPLFSSSHKFDSGTGWPSFYRPIDPNTIVYISDFSHGMERVEVRSRTGNSHLGHVFYGENESPSGARYCINSAALRFIPFGEMEEEGYAYLKSYIEA